MVVQSKRSGFASLAERMLIRKSCADEIYPDCPANPNEMKEIIIMRKIL